MTGINAPLGVTAERQSVNMMNVSGEHADVILLKHTLRWFVRNGQNSQKRWVYLENKKHILNIYSKEDKQVIPTYSSQGWEGLKLHAFFKKVTVTRIPRTVYRHLAERLICFVESTLGLGKKQSFFTATGSKGNKQNLTLRKQFFFIPKGEKTNKTSFSSCSDQTPASSSPPPQQSPPPSDLSNHYIAINKVKEAVRLPSWNKRQREKSESTDQSIGGDCAPRRGPSSGGISGGVVLVVIQVIVEGDDGADEFSELHEVGCDDVDAALSGPLRSDPLHHAR